MSQWPGHPWVIGKKKSFEEQVIVGRLISKNMQLANMPADLRIPIWLTTLKPSALTGHESIKLKALTWPFHQQAMWPSHDRTILISYIMTFTPCLNPFRIQKLLNWVCSTNIPRLGGQSFFGSAPGWYAASYRRSLPDSAEKPQTGFDIRGPKRLDSTGKQSSWTQFTHR